MKTFYRFAVLLALVSLAAKAHALPIGNKSDPVFTFQIINSTWNVQVVTVSTSVVTQVDTNPVAGRDYVEVQNIDATANLWCRDTNTAAINAGHKITPGTTWALSLIDKSNFGSSFSIYCLSDGAAATKAAVTQAK